MKRAFPAVAAIGVALTLASCSLLPAATPARDDSGQITKAEDNADVFAVKVGDCLNSGELADETASVPVVPCGEPHEDEVYYSHNITGATYPGDDEVAATADEVCAEQFEDFVGIPLDESELDFWNFVPTKYTWAENDREVLCVVYRLDPETGEAIRMTGTQAKTQH